MIRRLLFLVAAASLGAAAGAQEPPPPTLLVVISVDQLSTPLFDEYRSQFDGGLGELASGTIFRNGMSSGQSGVALGDAMKAQWPASREVVVSGSESPSAPLRGTRVDQRWHWAGKGFETGRPGAAVPRVVLKVNAAIASALAQPRPALEPTPFCVSKAVSPGGPGQLARAAGDAAAFRASPELDGDTLALAAGLVDEMRLGQAAAPDLLAIDLAGTGNVERAYGSDSEQMCLQLTELDRELGDFLSLLDSRGIGYAAVLMGTGKGPVPVLFWRQGFRGAAVDAPATLGDVERTLATLVGLPQSAGSAEGHCLQGTPAFCP